jgi:hypothetical protein
MRPVGPRTLALLACGLACALVTPARAHAGTTFRSTAAPPDSAAPLPWRYDPGGLGIGLWVEGGAAFDHGYGNSDDTYGFSSVDARNNPTGFAGAVGAEFELGIPNFGSAMLRAGVNVERYPFAAGSRLVNGSTTGGSGQILQMGARGKRVVSSFVAARVPVYFGRRVEPYAELGCGITNAQGAAREERDPVTGAVLQREEGVSSGGFYGEAAAGVILRRQHHDVWACLRAQGYTLLFTGGTSVQLLLGISAAGLHKHW